MWIFKLITQQGYFGNFTNDEFPFPIFCIFISWMDWKRCHFPYHRRTRSILSCHFKGKLLHQQGYLSNFTYINSPFFFFSGATSYASSRFSHDMCHDHIRFIINRHCSPDSHGHVSTQGK